MTKLLYCWIKNDGIPLLTSHTLKYQWDYLIIQHTHHMRISFIKIKVFYGSPFSIFSRFFIIFHVWTIPESTSTRTTIFLLQTYFLTFKKIMDDHFYDLQRLLKNGQKSDSFAAHFVQHFNNTTSRTDIRKCMKFKLIKQLNMIGAMKTFTKPNCNLYMQERLTILKKLRDKCVTLMNKNLDIYGACRHKTTFHRFCLSTYDSVF